MLSCHTVSMNAIFWVNRNAWLWGIQVCVAIISFSETLLVTYISYKIFHLPLRNLFIPVFLNCWLAKKALNNMLSDLHRVMQKSQSALSQQLIFLVATISCLVFTSVCGIQHLQRASTKPLTLFDSIWFVTVTFSTVGYGDVYPDIWPSKLFMIILICSAFIALPTQFEQLAFTWMERQKMGGNYNRRSQTECHVVVVATVLHADTIMDFLNEFYTHPEVQSYYVILLSSGDLDPTMKLILQVPIWAARVIYIKGSALKDSDLSRCRSMQHAQACFMIAARTYLDKTAADQHTILRSWAVKDFAPRCPQYVQIFRPESKLHVHFAEHVVCEDEFKYALLANNCLFPGMSTLVTLLLHTSRGAEGQTARDEWMHLYGYCSGNEIYDIQLCKSQFFGEYVNKSFTYASFHAHRKYGVALVGIKVNPDCGSILLNPGPHHIMQPENICFYMSITKEENSAFVLAHPNISNHCHLSSQQTQPPLSKNPPFKMKTPLLSSEILNEPTYYSSVHQHQDATNSINSVAEPSSAPAVMFNSTSTSTPNFQTSQHLRKPKFISFSTFKCESNKSNCLAAPPMVLYKSYAKPANLASEENSTSELDDDEVLYDPSDKDADDVEIFCGFPPVTPYIGTTQTLCHLVKTARPLCCLHLTKTCDHCKYKQALDYKWANKSIIVAAENANSALYNFVVPLRSHSRPMRSLHPIVLLLEEEPKPTFLETMSHFPMVYWMIGTIENLDDLIQAGIHKAYCVVVANKESSNAGKEDTLSDCNTIVAVQSMFRLFPNANIITELSLAPNMRFMQFRAQDNYALDLSKLEKKEKEKGSHLYYMFRLPFAAGNVFTSSMLDTLLYQAFVKNYLIKFVRLLIGIDQEVGSGHLSSLSLITSFQIRLSESNLNVCTYGRLYQKLSSTTFQVPIGIYRTENQDKWSIFHVINTLSKKDSQDNAEKEIEQMIKNRLIGLGLPLKQQTSMSSNRKDISYVIINPGYDTQLHDNDIIYVIKPYSLSPYFGRKLTDC
ncbi:hypothetical protein HELRODRAFT_111253 [Helobdella robusta]|uniref:RCK N-terminal domain-containing protein n=1 Tax=Helobdella robusta TaxID=6412 RepID=T1EF99_HELRO|nr:hypothetical protein HELRODRAFT_111253 [Helobdella robusta]ESO05295.1 hypothetical protein HELRODRAFT_111253 [Helobdella robusta]